DVRHRLPRPRPGRPAVRTVRQPRNAGESAGEDLPRQRGTGVEAGLIAETYREFPGKWKISTHRRHLGGYPEVTSVSRIRRRCESSVRAEPVPPGERAVFTILGWLIFGLIAG